MLINHKINRYSSTLFGPGACFLVLLTLSLNSCKKLVTIDEPTKTITTAGVFNTNAQANSAMAGVYTKMINNNNIVFSNSGTSILSGLSSDELVLILQDPAYYQFNSNRLSVDLDPVSSSFWAPAYSNIYDANAVIEGIAASKSSLLHDSVRNQLTGEAKFIRAFCYFYLTNLFGDVPLALSVTDFNETAKLARAPQAGVYQQIVQDLKDAQGLLVPDYSVGGGERIRPNKWAATALLARVYLYLGNWADAEAQATAVINNSARYSLVNNLNQVFLKNSTEAIWQLAQQNTNVLGIATLEGMYSIPSPLSIGPVNWSLSSQLLSAFAPGDKRKIAWVDSTTNAGATYYYPFKYKTGEHNNRVPATPTEYYMVLRLAEQYLIRGEARAKQGNIIGAATDLNIVRLRAGLANTTAITQADLLAAIYKERQVELFAEWGHRWLDLKRTGQAQAVLSQIPMKQPWRNEQLLYPIPHSEIVKGPNLIQNPGY